MKRTLIISTLALFSCSPHRDGAENKNGVEISVHNELLTTIASATISTSDGGSVIKLVDIEKGLKKNAFLDMTDIAKTDGHYIVEIIASGQARTDEFGYYTNGFSQERLIHIHVAPDTIKYNYVFKER